MQLERRYINVLLIIIITPPPTMSDTIMSVVYVSRLLCVASWLDVAVIAPT